MKVEELKSLLMSALDVLDNFDDNDNIKKRN